MEDISYYTLRTWQAFYNRNPWGETRADMRTEVQSQRIVAGVYGIDEKHKPKPNYPYWQEQVEPADLLKFMRHFEQHAVPKPGGGYAWSEDCP